MRCMSPVGTWRRWADGGAAPWASAGKWGAGLQEVQAGLSQGVLSEGTPPTPAPCSTVPGATASAGLSLARHINPAQRCPALCLLLSSQQLPLFKNYNCEENWGDSSLHHAVCEELAGTFPPTAAALSGGFNS